MADPDKSAEREAKDEEAERGGAKRARGEAEAGERAAKSRRDGEAGGGGDGGAGGGGGGKGDGGGRSGRPAQQPPSEHFGGKGGGGRQPGPGGPPPPSMAPPPPHWQQGPGGGGGGCRRGVEGAAGAVPAPPARPGATRGVGSRGWPGAWGLGAGWHALAARGTSDGPAGGGAAGMSAGMPPGMPPSLAAARPDTGAPPAAASRPPRGPGARRAGGALPVAEARDAAALRRLRPSALKPRAPGPADALREARPWELEHMRALFPAAQVAQHVAEARARLGLAAEADLSASTKLLGEVVTC